MLQKANYNIGLFFFFEHCCNVNAACRIFIFELCSKLCLGLGPSIPVLSAGADYASTLVDQYYCILIFFSMSSRVLWIGSLFHILFCESSVRQYLKPLPTRLDVDPHMLITTALMLFVYSVFHYVSFVCEFHTC